MAQENVFYLNEDKRYFITGVEELPTMTLDQLFINAHAFMKKIQANNEKYEPGMNNDTLKAIKTPGTFTVQNYGSLKKHIDGVVTYELLIEMKAGKYRYNISNFNFTPYERNRYGKFVAVSGISIPLETKPSKLNEKNWNSYKIQVLKKSYKIAEFLRESMEHKEIAETEKNTNHKNW
jgi:hypothetical protein